MLPFFQEFLKTEKSDFYTDIPPAAVVFTFTYEFDVATFVVLPNKKL